VIADLAALGYYEMVRVMARQTVRVSLVLGIRLRRIWINYLGCFFLASLFNEERNVR
jgi:hypothetical protein